MFWFIVILVVICSLSGTFGDKQERYRVPGRLSGSEKKRMRRMEKVVRKAREKAKMDAWEDMMSIAEAFMDD